jgi:hypothetical protein
MIGTSLYLYLLVLMLCGSQKILGESNNEEEEQGKLTHISIYIYMYMYTYKQNVKTRSYTLIIFYM